MVGVMGCDWQAFETAAPELAHIGRSLLHRPDRGEVGILATVDGRGMPRMAPVCPIFAGDGVYLSIGSHTPKLEDLARRAAFALHAQVGEDDLEFQIRGHVRPVETPAERALVIAAIPFPSYDPEDPIFELLIEQALAVSWTGAGAGRRKLTWRVGAPVVSA